MNTMLFFRVVPLIEDTLKTTYSENICQAQNQCPSLWCIQVFWRKIIALKKLYFPTGFPCQLDSGKSLVPSGKNRKTPTTDFDRCSFNNPWMNFIWMISVPHELTSSQCLMHCTKGWLWSMIPLHKLVPCTIYDTAVSRRNSYFADTVKIRF